MGGEWGRLGGGGIEGVRGVGRLEIPFSLGKRASFSLTFYVWRECQPSNWQTNMHHGSFFSQMPSSKGLPRVLG